MTMYEMFLSEWAEDIRNYMDDCFNGIPIRARRTDEVIRKIRRLATAVSVGDYSAQSFADLLSYKCPTEFMD